MAVYAKTLKWNRWAGELGQVVNVTQGVIETLKSADHDYPDCSIRIRTSDLTTSDMSLKDLGAVSESDLQHLRTLSVTVGRQYTDSESVVITLSQMAPALEVQIRGIDRTVVDGLSAQLQRNLDSGHRFPRWYSRTWSGPFLVPPFGFSLATTLAIFLNLLIRSVGWTSRDDRWEPAEIGVLVIALALGATFAILTYWLFPDLELLPLGGQTRARRYRRGAITTLLTLAGGIVTSLIASAISTAGTN